MCDEGLLLPILQDHLSPTSVTNTRCHHFLQRQPYKSMQMFIRWKKKCQDKSTKHKYAKRYAHWDNLIRQKMSSLKRKDVCDWTYRIFLFNCPEGTLLSTLNLKMKLWNNAKRNNKEEKKLNHISSEFLTVFFLQLIDRILTRRPMWPNECHIG